MWCWRMIIPYHRWKNTSWCGWNRIKSSFGRDFFCTRKVQYSIHRFSVLYLFSKLRFRFAKFMQYKRKRQKQYTSTLLGVDGNIVDIAKAAIFDSSRRSCLLGYGSVGRTTLCAYCLVLLMQIATPALMIANLWSVIAWFV